MLKLTLMKNKSPTKSSIQARIRRAVASSTAIETGQAVKTLESRLKAKSSKFQHLKLAN